MSPKHRVQVVREAKGMKVYELARRAQVAPSTIYNIESPDWKRKTQYSVAERIADVLGVSVGELFDIQHELTPKGRPAGTSGATRSPARSLKSVGTAIRTVAKITPQANYGDREISCPHCHLATLRGATCLQCDRPLPQT